MSIKEGTNAYLDGLIEISKDAMLDKLKELVDPLSTLWRDIPQTFKYTKGGIVFTGKFVSFPLLGNGQLDIGKIGSDYSDILIRLTSVNTRGEPVRTGFCGCPSPFMSQHERGSKWGDGKSDKEKMEISMGEKKLIALFDPKRDIDFARLDRSSLSHIQVKILDSFGVLDRVG